MVAEINDNLVVYLTAYLGLHQRKHQSSTSLTLCEGNPMYSRHSFPSQRADNVEGISLSRYQHTSYVDWLHFNTDLS